MDETPNPRRPAACAPDTSRAAAVRWIEAARRVAAVRRVRCAGLLALAQLAAGCAVYQPLPLARAPHLAERLSDLTTTVPSGMNAPAERGADGALEGTPTSGAHSIDIRRPLTLDEIGWLALLNDPELAAQRGQLDVAHADLLQESLLPNPSASVSYEAFLGGPGSTPAWSASLSEDIAALVTYRARVEAARATVEQVNAQLLWDEWQVAEKARLTALDLYWDGQSIGAAAREHDLLGRAIREIRRAVAAGNLGASALAPLAAAQAAADQSLASLRLGRLQHWQALDALLGLAPAVRFAIAAPQLPPRPADLQALIASLPRRRPDLIALRLGYRSADRSVRAAILEQFPALVLGGTWAQDTSNVRSAGPAVTFDLPVFDHGQGRVARARATRRLLRAQYLSRLDAAVGEVRGLDAQERRLTAEIARARDAAASAASLARSARSAYAQGNLDQRSLADYETAALERELEADALERSRGEMRIASTLSLALGLPDTLILQPERTETP